MEETFTGIWREGAWIPPAGGATKSGCGSTLAYTENLRCELPAIIERFGIRSLFDAPCGDFNWMRLVQFPDGLRYSGGDVVAPLIAELQVTYPQLAFRHFDLTADPLPECDLLFCRDCLIHFSYRDIARMLERFLVSRAEFIMTTSYPIPDNADIATGGFRPINLQEAPFEFGVPLASINDWINGWPPRAMLLWRRDDIAQQAQGFIDRYLD